MNLVRPLIILSSLVLLNTACTKSETQDPNVSTSMTEELKQENLNQATATTTLPVQNSEATVEPKAESKTEAPAASLKPVATPSTTSQKTQTTPSIADAKK